MTTTEIDLEKKFKSSKIAHLVPEKNESFLVRQALVLYYCACRSIVLTNVSVTWHWDWECYIEWDAYWSLVWWAITQYCWSKKYRNILIHQSIRRKAQTNTRLMHNMEGHVVGCFVVLWREKSNVTFYLSNSMSTIHVFSFRTLWDR